MENIYKEIFKICILKLEGVSSKNIKNIRNDKRINKQLILINLLLMELQFFACII